MPVSFQTLSRFGPRHCGQSAALADRDNSMANKVANPNLEWKFIQSFVKCMVILSGRSGEDTPLACRFRRRAENIVPQTFSHPKF
jgi:hypothetical protein